MIEWNAAMQPFTMLQTNEIFTDRLTVWHHALGSDEMFFVAAAQVVDLTPIPEHPSTNAAISAMIAVTGGRKPLPSPAFDLCFPILAAVLSWPTHSPLHDPALTVLGLHVDPQLPSPRGKMLQLLYHVLGLIPAFRYHSSFVIGVSNTANKKAAFKAGSISGALIQHPRLCPARKFEQSVQSTLDKQEAL